MSNSKDKRTKEQILRLLDRAMEQDERLSEKIKSLEIELADCRKKAENPRHELTEEAMPASKVSFRIDYYRTSEESPLKGIIEHLPSRQNKPFEGEGHLVINHFMNRFLTEETRPEKKKKISTKAKIAPEEPAVVLELENQKKEIEKQPPAPPPQQEEEIMTSGSRLLERLRAEFTAQMQTTQLADPSASSPVQRQKISTRGQPTLPHKGKGAEHRSRLIERLREEQLRQFKSV